MKTASLDTSAINWIFNKKFNAIEFNELLKLKGYTPVVGMDTIYELERCFIQYPEKGKNLFYFLNQLNPVYICQRQIIYEQELSKLTQGSSVNALLGYFSEEILRMRIKDNITGISNHNKFIKERQFFWNDCRKKLWTPEGVKRNLKLELNDYLLHCIKQITMNIKIVQDWLKFLTNKTVLIYYAKNFIKNINNFPALRTALYSQFYLNFLLIKNLTTPSEDKFTDSLQVISSSYSTAIISDDKYLIKTLAPAVNPDIQLLEISKIIS